MKYESVPLKTAVINYSKHAVIVIIVATLLLSWDSIGILLLYSVNLMLLYMIR